MKPSWRRRPQSQNCRFLGPFKQRWASNKGAVPGWEILAEVSYSLLSLSLHVCVYTYVYVFGYFEVYCLSYSLVEPLFGTWPWCNFGVFELVHDVLY